MIKHTIVLICLLLMGCNNQDKATAPPIINVPPVSNTPITDNSSENNYFILLFGNSHVASNDLGGLISALITTNYPQKTVSYTRASKALFLDERVTDPESNQLIQQQPWTHVILQAQKYSVSGTADYPIDGALHWIEQVKNISATPILFPEHAQQGNPEEGTRVHQLHQRITQQNSSCIAPIGLAWNEALSQYPQLQLYRPDGNHAQLLGSFLTALVFYYIISADQQVTLEPLTTVAIDEITQQQLADIAQSTLAAYPACTA